MSKSWNSIIENTPAFWTVLDCAACCHWIRLAIKRSQQAPITILCEGASENVLTSRSAPVTSLPFLKGTVHRWRELACWIQKRYSLPVLLTGASAPCLESLELRVDHKQGLATVELFSGDVPRLTRLALSAKSFNWKNVARMQNLQHMYITLTSAASVLDLDGFVEALGSIKGSLKTLTLTWEGHERPGRTFEVRWSGPDAVQLENLEYLEVNYFPLGPTFTFLNAIRIPALLRGYVRFQVGLYNAGEALDHLGSYIEGNRDTFVTGLDFWMSDSEDYLLMVVMYPGPRLKFEIFSFQWFQIYALWIDTERRLPGIIDYRLIQTVRPIRDPQEDEDTVDRMERWSALQITKLEFEFDPKTVEDRVVVLYEKMIDLAPKLVTGYRSLFEISLPYLEDAVPMFTPLKAFLAGIGVRLIALND